MSILKSMVSLVIMMVSISFSLDITISGKVTDTGTTPLPNAAVKLEKYGLTATTDNNGSFTLTGTVGINNTNGKLQNNKLSAHIGGNGVLFLDIRERGPIDIVTYNLQGKAVSRVNNVMDIGSHSIEQPYIGDGVYLCRIKSGKTELLIKSHSIGRIFNRKEVSDKGGSSSTVSAKRPGRAPIDDVIAVIKDGYLNYRVIVTNSDTGNIEIKMIVCADTVRDIDGNLYQAVRIGDQVWTVENLRVTRYNDGSAIPLVTGNSEWGSLSTPGYCYYNNTNDSYLINKYGALYNWWAVGTKKLAPKDWHVPDTTDWNILKNYLIASGYNWDGTMDSNKIAKSIAAKTDWYISTNLGAIGNDLNRNNRSGFSALPGGQRDYYFSFIDSCGVWWSATNIGSGIAYYYVLQFDSENIFIVNHWMSKGLSVRLVKD